LERNVHNTLTGVIICWDTSKKKVKGNETRELTARVQETSEGNLTSPRGDGGRRARQEMGGVRRKEGKRGGVREGSKAWCI